jgi:regulator of protease activity HflC (stomatin/prohibitin superfamily)
MAGAFVRFSALAAWLADCCGRPKGVEAMYSLKIVLLLLGLGLLAASGGRVGYDLHQTWRALKRDPDVPWRRPRMRMPLRLAALALLSLLVHQAIVIVPSGLAGVRVSQLSGTRPGTLYPGVHFVKPLLERVVLFDTRDRILATSTETGQKVAALSVQSKEGLALGLAVTVRYRLDPSRLDYVHGHLPSPVEEELVPPVVASVFRELVPRYTVREVFAARRAEVRDQAALLITAKLAADAIVVKEVMLRDIALPAEYAKGLEGLLLREQENERMTYDIQIKEKQVRTAELEAEAQKAREVKHAEAQAQVKVLQAKAEADAMQHTLPLKQKQVEQTRLEAEARKESTLKNAEASAQAKVIDARAEVEKSRLMADADANRTRVTAAADAERMRQEADVLTANPLLIQKIVAERLSDKMQIMMVPMDGRDFFATDVLRSFAAMPASPSPSPAPVERSTPRRTAKR